MVKLSNSHSVLICSFIFISPFAVCVPKHQIENDTAESNYTTVPSTFQSSIAYYVDELTIINNGTTVMLVSNNATEVSMQDTMFTNNDGAKSQQALSTNDEATEEQLADLRIQMVKLQILSKLKLKEPLQFAVKPSKSSQETIQILLNEAKMQEKSSSPNNNEERLVIHSKYSGANCREGNDMHFCKTFHFDVTTDLNYSKTSLWIFNVGETTSELLITIYYSNDEEEEIFPKYRSLARDHGWNKIDFPMIEIPRTWNDHVQCIVEIAGPNIEEQGERRPFLMVTKVSYPNSRLRRDASCNINDNCCWRPLRVSFRTMGFDFVLYPEYLDINMCTGKCRLDHTEMRTHYERAMSQVLKQNSRLHDSLGKCWTLCCKPKEMDAVRVIYNDTDGIIHDHYIPELTVKSCTCN